LATRELYDPLRKAVDQERQRRRERWRSRSTHGSPPPSSSALRLRPEEVPLMRRILDVGYRQLARTTHPDVGGDTREMQELNALADRLRTQLAAMEK
jgi:hypothetical protein